MATRMRGRHVVKPLALELEVVGSETRVVVGSQTQVSRNGSFAGTPRMGTGQRKLEWYMAPGTLECEFLFVAGRDYLAVTTMRARSCTIPSLVVTNIDFDAPREDVRP